jgi:hypothetical protein
MTFLPIANKFALITHTDERILFIISSNKMADKINISCSYHKAEPIRRVCKIEHTKSLYCIECLMAETDTNVKSHLITLEDFCKEMDKALHHEIKSSSEAKAPESVLEVLNGKDDAIKNFTELCLKEKEKVYKRMQEIEESTVKAVHHLRDNLLQILDLEIEGFARKYKKMEDFVGRFFSTGDGRRRQQSEH